MIVMACYALNARSQTDESRNFIYLNSDSVIHADRIRLRPDFGGSLVLRADSRRVPLEQVKFFNNEDGFFANTRKTDLFAGNSFSERIVKGKINLYQEVAYDPVLSKADRLISLLPVLTKLTKPAKIAAPAATYIIVPTCLPFL